MERLTEYEGVAGHAHAYVNGYDPEYAIQRLAAYEDIGSPEEFRAYKDTGLTPDEIKSGINDATDLARIAIALRKLRRYEYAEQSGRRVVLPCKVGDILWTYHNYPTKGVYSFRVTDVAFLNGIGTLNTDRVGVIRWEDIGKTVYTTREEAEHALEVSGK